MFWLVSGGSCAPVARHTEAQATTKSRLVWLSCLHAPDSGDRSRVSQAFTWSSTLTLHLPILIITLSGITKRRDATETKVA